MAEQDRLLITAAGMLLIILLLIVVLIRQARAHRQALLQAERLFQRSRQEAQQQAGQDLMYVQGLLHDQEQDTASRVDAVGARVDGMARLQEERLRELTRVIDGRLSANDEKVERMRETLHRSVSEMQRENAQKLDEMRKTVDEHLHATLNKRLGESFQQVSERLEQVYLGLGEMKTLANGVGDLKRVLSNVKTRGGWGEVQLGALLDDLLVKGQYEANVAVRPGSQERVEYAILLPGREGDGPVYLAVDAKFPLEAYERLQLAQDEGEKEGYLQAQSALAQAIRVEAARIASKYVAPPATVDFALMYLPSEGLYAQVLQIPGLAEELQRKYRVVPSGPVTLTALLNSLQMGFRTLAIERHSAEVWRLLSAVKEEFGRFGDILDKTQQRLRQASESIEDATRRSRTIENKLKDVQRLEPGEEGNPPRGEYTKK